jgi:hypothetical protein
MRVAAKSSAVAAVHNVFVILGGNASSENV